MKNICRITAFALLCAFTTIAPANEPGEVGESISVPTDKDLNVNGRLEFVGGVAYSLSNSNQTITFGFDKLQNSSSTHYSGTIHVRMILSTTPLVHGQAYSYWILGQYSLNQLLPLYYYEDISYTVPLSTAPNGDYYIYIASFEYEANPGCTPGGYCLDDFVGFSKKIRVTNGVFTQIDDVAPTTAAVEYFNAAFGHYFVTADPAEIAGLDAGAYNFAFQRTGQQWKVWTSGSALDLCRFFTTPGTFGTKSSHFYTAVASECNGLKFNPAWIYEKIAGKVGLPTGGVCPAGTQILYRLYNQGQTGAPNHRYTTSLAIRSQMIAQGFAPEDPNNACVPL